MMAVALIVIEVETRPRGMPSNSSAMSSMESIATPTLPTSPAESGWGAGGPLWVGGVCGGEGNRPGNPDGGGHDCARHCNPRPRGANVTNGTRRTIDTQQWAGVQ